MPLQHGEQLLVAGQGLQLHKVVRVRGDWQRRFAAGAFGEAQQRPQEFLSGSTLLVGLAGDAGCLEELAQLQALPGVHRGALHAEVRAGYLALVQLPGLQRHAICGAAHVACPEQTDERRIRRIPRPAVRRCREVRPDFPALPAGPDETQNRGANAMLVRLAGEAHGLQGVLRTVSSAFDHQPPTAVVGIAELRVEAHQGRFGGGLHLVGKGGLQTLVAAALDHLGVAYDTANQGAQVVLRLRGAGLHASAGLRAFFRRWHAFVLNRLVGGTLRGDQPRQFFDIRPRNEQVNQGVVLASGTSVSQHAVLAGAPAVAHANRHAVSALLAGWRFCAKVQIQLAGLLGLAL